MTPETSQNTAVPPEPKKHSITARLLAALAFATVTSKISWAGAVFDAKNIYKDLSSGEKIKGMGAGLKKMGEHIHALMAKENISKPVACAKLFKYSIITWVVGAAAGATLGWVRGGEIEDWKDIIHHPIRSTKLVLGLEKKPEMKLAGVTIPAQDVDKHDVSEEKEAPASAKKWTSTMQKTSHIENALKPDTEISSARL